MASHKLPPIDFLARGLAMARRLLEDPHLQFSTIGERPSIIKKITDCLPPGFLQGGLTIYARIEKVQTTIQYERSEAFLLQVINLETRGVEKSDVIRILEKLDFYFISQKGSHIKIRRIVNGNKQNLFVPNHKEIKKGTLKQIYNQSLRYISEDKLKIIQDDLQSLQSNGYTLFINSRGNFKSVELLLLHLDLPTH